MKKEVTFDNYIAMCDRYQESEFHCGDWWPDVLDIKTKLEPKIEQHLEFLIWISETANPPKNAKQKESRDYINKLLRENLIFIEEKKKSKSDTEIECVDNDSENIIEANQENIEENITE